MAAFNTPPGTTIPPPAAPVGRPDVLVAVPVGSNYTAPTTPTTGQIWPRGAP